MILSANVWDESPGVNGILECNVLEFEFENQESCSQVNIKNLVIRDLVLVNSTLMCLLEYYSTVKLIFEHGGTS